MDGPCKPAPGAAPEGGKFRVAKPVCRGGLLFGYFLLAKQEKVTRRKGEKDGASRIGNFDLQFSISKWFRSIISSQLHFTAHPGDYLVIVEEVMVNRFIDHRNFG